MTIELPRPLGPFLLLRHLASGGMGDVYLAHQRLGVGERLCVVKTIRPELASTPGLIGRFLDEARTTALVSHRNVASVLDVGNVDGTAYIAVEYIAGRDLQTIASRSRKARKPLPENVALYIVGELLEALAYVHRATDPRTGEPLHIVHRDVSPHNILVSFEGEVKLIDFGIARSTIKQEHTQMGQAVGKLRYMAPEQARAKPVDGAADVYAAAIVAVELLTGRRFYADLSFESVAMQLGAESTPPPRVWQGVPDALRRVLEPALLPDPRARPTASALKEQLLAAQLERRSLTSSEGLRAYLEQLFDGEKHREQQARARLMREPTSMNAAALLSSQSSGYVGGETAIEETPVEEDEGRVDRDAPTVMEFAGNAIVRAGGGREPQETSATMSVAPAPLHTSSGAAVRRHRRSRGTAAQLASAAILVVAAVALVAIMAELLLRKEPTRAPVPLPLPIAQLDPMSASTSLSPPTVATTPTPTTTATATSAAMGAGTSENGANPSSRARPDAGSSDLAPDGGAAGSPAVTTPAGDNDNNGDRSGGGSPRGRRRSTAPKKESGLFGDRLRALKNCAPRPGCAPLVLKRAADVGSLTVEELRDLDEDLDRCLERCQ